MQGLFRSLVVDQERRAVEREPLGVLERAEIITFLIPGGLVIFMALSLIRMR